MGDDMDDSLFLRFYEPKRPDVHSTAASVLAQSLDALQRLVYLVAMQREGWTPRQRVRPPAGLQSRYRLVCNLPQPGSFVSPVRIEGNGLLASGDIGAVVKVIDVLLTAIGKSDENAFITVVPDETWQRYYLDTLARIVPHSLSGIELEISHIERVLVDTTKARPFIDRLARTPSRISVRGSLIGEFKRIDFMRQEITVRHRQTGRDLSCNYEPHVEESLLHHPRDLLLVFGTVTRDHEGMPVSIDSVDHIEPVNLESEEIEAVIAGNLRVVPKEKISAEVSFDETDAVYIAAIPDLGISVFSEKREDLRDALDDEIALLWKRYAAAPDEKLTRAAQVLKQRMLDTFHGEDNAA